MTHKRSILSSYNNYNYFKKKKTDPTQEEIAAENLRRWASNSQVSYLHV
jgi:hypothetical protein